MKSTPFALLTCLSLLASMTTSCVSYTTYRDEPRRSATFSSSRTAQIFYDSYLQAADPHGDGVLALSLPLPYTRRNLAKDNVRFNAAIQQADRDRNGIISLTEARAFASSQTGEQKHRAR